MCSRVKFFLKYALHISISLKYKYLPQTVIIIILFLKSISLIA